MDPFETLGLPRRYDIDLVAAAKAHRELSRALHPDRYAQAGASERRDALSRAATVNEAWRIVRDPITRAEALFALLGVPVGEDKEPKVDQEFLMEMLEQREALAEAREHKDGSRVGAIVVSILERQRAAETALASGLSSDAPQGFVGKLGELRFYRRFLDQAAAIEED
jgi:molecular chaperone HscB